MCQQGLIDTGGWLTHFHGNEVACRRDVGKPHAIEAFRQLLQAGFVHLPGFLQIGFILKNSCGRRQGNGIDIEWLANPVQDVSNGRRTDAVAHSQRCKPPRLGKGAADNQVRVFFQQPNTIRVLVTNKVFAVGFIQNNQNLFRDTIQKRFNRIGGVHGTGGIIRISNKHQLGALAHRIGHGIQIMPPVLCRHRHTSGANRLGYQRVYCEGILGKHHFAIRVGETPGNDFQHIVGTITEGDLAHFHAKATSQSLLQIKAIAVRVQAHFIEGISGGR